VALVAALAPLVVALLPGPRVTQVVIFCSAAATAGQASDSRLDHLGGDRRGG
jgi:hypothetical protein